MQGHEGLSVVHIQWSVLTVNIAPPNACQHNAMLIGKTAERGRQVIIPVDLFFLSVSFFIQLPKQLESRTGASTLELSCETNPQSSSSLYPISRTQ